MLYIPRPSYSILSLGAIKHLNEHNNPLFSLLSGLFSSEIEKFIHLINKHQSELHLDSQMRSILEQRIRLSVFKGLVQSDPSKRIYSFDELKSKLIVSSDIELEELLIRGVGDKVIDVKIDDITKKIRILRADDRYVDSKTSAMQKNLLASWKESLQKINEVRSSQ